MTRRREFLKSGVAAVLPAGVGRSWRSDTSVLLEARAFVDSGALGEVRFCRVAHRGWLQHLPFVLGERGGWIADVDPRAQGAQLLGSRATLMMDRHGCRLFPSCTSR